MKTQVIIDKRTKIIECIQQAAGHVHDFKLYAQTVGGRIAETILEIGDSGYQGIHKFHANSIIPLKASKKHHLTKEQKKRNREISKARIVIEHINAVIKVFKIFAYPYRNHLKRFGSRMSLVCAIINYETMLHPNVGRGY
jgi:IS5 family transposase